MAPTFYGVLGVGPDADAEAIERGYRERVTEVHPDVSDDPDADAQFKRLTTARDTLLDADERSRYDRLGHVPYVRHHVSCSAWESTVSGGAATAGSDDTQSTRRDRGRTTAAGSSRSGSSNERRRTRPGGNGRSRTRDWNTGRNTGQRRSGRSDATATSRSAASGDTGFESTGEADSGGDSGSSSWSARAGRGGRRRSRESSSGDAGVGGGSTYASSSFWESQRVGQRVGSRNRTREPFPARLFRGIQALGVWVLIHLAFLTAAVGTSWYVYVVVLDSSTASLPLLVVLVGEVVLAAVLSSIHVANRIYR